MRRQEIISKTGVSQTTFTTYLRLGIILSVSQDGDTKERDYDSGSVERIKGARQLTSLGFRLEDIKKLLDKHDGKEVLSRMDSLSLGDFQHWVNEEVPGSRNKL